MVLHILVNTGSGKALVPDGTKPLPEPMLTCHCLMTFCGIHLRSNLLHASKLLFRKTSENYTHSGVELQLNEFAIEFEIN